MESDKQQPAPSQSSRPTRPVSITIISWILIIWGIYAIYSTYALIAIGHGVFSHIMTMNAYAIGIPPLAYIAVCFAGLIITPITGISMLLRCGWMRLIYVTWYIVWLTLNFLSDPQYLVQMIPGAVMSVIFAILVFRPVANKYFSRKHPSHRQ